MANMNEDNISAVFDNLVTENVIIYGPHKSIKCEAEGYPVSHSISVNIPGTWLIKATYRSSFESAST
jgi:hypothetical protein